MTKKDWLLNIETVADSISSELGTTDVVKSVLSYYGARSLYDLSPSYYPDAFSDLQQIEADIA